MPRHSEFGSTVHAAMFARLHGRCHRIRAIDAAFYCGRDPVLLTIHLPMIAALVAALISERRLAGGFAEDLAEILWIVVANQDADIAEPQVLPGQQLFGLLDAN